jgi:hypothetical protein
LDQCGPRLTKFPNHQDNWLLSRDGEGWVYESVRPSGIHTRNDLDFDAQSP